MAYCGGSTILCCNFLDEPDCVVEVLKEMKFRMLKLRVGYFNDLTKNMMSSKFRHRAQV